MKKTITSIALLVSASSAFSMPMPRDPNAPEPVLKTICMSTYKAHDGSIELDGCDATPNNKQSGVALMENGCAKGQSAIQTYGEIAINACMPPGMAQL